MFKAALCSFFFFQCIFFFDVTSAAEGPLLVNITYELNGNSEIQSTEVEIKNLDTTKNKPVLIFLPIKINSLKTESNELIGHYNYSDYSMIIVNSYTEESIKIIADTSDGYFRNGAKIAENVFKFLVIPTIDLDHIESTWKNQTTIVNKFTEVSVILPKGTEIIQSGQTITVTDIKKLKLEFSSSSQQYQLTFANNQINILSSLGDVLILVPLLITIIIGIIIPFAKEKYKKISMIISSILLVVLCIIPWVTHIMYGDNWKVAITATICCLFYFLGLLVIKTPK